MRLATHYDTTRHVGLIEAFDDNSTCVGSRTVSTIQELKHTLQDFALVVTLPTNVINHIVYRYTKAGLPDIAAYNKGTDPDQESNVTT